MTTIQEHIINIVEDFAPIKGVELVSKLTQVLAQTGELNILENDTYFSILNKMVSNNEIVELEYVLPKMNYRVKSMYFPKGTVTTPINGGSIIDV